MQLPLFYTSTINIIIKQRKRTNSSNRANFSWTDLYFWPFFSDLSLQDSLLHDFNNVSNVRSVRIGHTGRHGRYAVIYLATMSDVAKALDESRLITKSYPSAEVDVILAGDEVVEDK